MGQKTVRFGRSEATTTVEYTRGLLGLDLEGVEVKEAAAEHIEIEAYRRTFAQFLSDGN